MRVMREAEMTMMSIEECQKLDTPLRHDLEVMDYQIRSLVARYRQEAGQAGADDTIFVKATSTLLLAIAAGLVARAAEDRRAPFDASSFAACAGNAARWAEQRRLRYGLGGEA